MSLFSLINLLQNRASQHPNRIAYTFLEDGKKPIASLTYGQLDEKARAIATYLQSQLSVGDRVLLVYPQGLESIAAFLGCLYAGVVAIPAPAPEATRLKRILPRLEAIAADAGASLILTTASLLANRDGNHLTFKARSFVSRLNGRASLLLNYYLAEGEIAQKTPQLATIPWTATDKIPAQLAAQWQEPEINGDTLAYLQYTSGSTSTPKGVMLDHKNLMGHLAELQQACSYDSNSISVTWMPYFHDYGLVEGILAPLYNGTPCYLMSPMAFIKQPLRWLKAIDCYRATHSQAPNFAYAYCLKRITPPERATLDLSSWQAAGNAAEPINPEVMEQFCQTFESCGFRRQTFAPAYGLAEATLLVTTSRRTDDWVFCTVSAEELAQNRIVETPTGQKLAGSGRLLGNTVVAIVHPKTLTRCASDEFGEIWVSSAGVARGYWQRPDATQETFRAYLADTGEGPFLRTGDLGFIQDGELFITGRLKDLIIIRGENYYPHDIEWVVEKSHAALRPNYGAAFAIEVDGVEQLVIAFEVERQKSKNLNVDEVVGAIRNAVAEHYELPIYGVVLLKRGSIPKTSSGKIQRQACRKAFVDGSLDSIAIWTLASADLQQETTPQNDIEFQLIQIWRRVLGITSISTKDNFFELGGDSLKAAVVVAEVEKILSQAIPFGSLVEAPTIEQLANLLVWESRKEKFTSLVPINPNGNKRPFFYIHGLPGYNLDIQSALARYMDRPFYGIQAVGINGEKAPYTHIEDIVDHYIQEIQIVQPESPYLLGGVCIGGNIAFEIAQKLRKRGQQVLLVVMVDSPNPFITEEEKTNLSNWYPQQRLREQLINKGLNVNQVENIFRVWEANIQVIANHRPHLYADRVVYFSAQEKVMEKHRFDPMQTNGWNTLVAGGIELHQVSGSHLTMHFEPYVRELVNKINACLKEAEADLTQEATPENNVESKLVQIWQRVLGISSISIKDNFFELGGDSLKAAVLTVEVEKAFNQDVSLATLAAVPTIWQLANLLGQHKGKVKSRSLIPINPKGGKRPFFYVHGIMGYGYHAELARYLDPERPFYGLQAVGIDGEADPYTYMEDMVRHYIQEIQTVQPEGAYLLGGQCMGGNVALAMAQELKNRGQEVLLVVMSDSPNPEVKWLDSWRFSGGKQHDRETIISYGFSPRQVENILKVIEANHQILSSYQPQPYKGRVVYFSVQENQEYLKESAHCFNENQEYLKESAHCFNPMHTNGWNSWVEDGIEVIGVPGRHGTYHNEPHVQFLAEKLNTCLDRAEYEEFMNAPEPKVDDKDAGINEYNCLLAK